MILTSLSPNFSQSWLICVKSLTVVPHKVAVFWIRTTLPFRDEKSSWKENLNNLKKTGYAQVHLLA